MKNHLVGTFGLALLVLFFTRLAGISALFAPVREKRAVKRRTVKRCGKSSNAWPCVSVVVPAFNEGKVVAATVSSLLKTHYPRLEIIVIDDGSSDRGSAGIRAEFLKKWRNRLNLKRSFRISDFASAGRNSAKVMTNETLMQDAPNYGFSHRRIYVLGLHRDIFE